MLFQHPGVLLLLGVVVVPVDQAHQPVHRRDGVTICTLPTVIVFFILQRSFTEAVAGAVK